MSTFKIERGVLLLSLVVAASLAMPVSAWAEAPGSRGAGTPATVSSVAAEPAPAPVLAGGKVPTAALPWYGVLVAGLVLTLAGTIGFWSVGGGR